MPKRFRDSATYKDRFVKSLSIEMKHIWFYILDDCDNAGIWRVDLEGAGLYTRCNFTASEIKDALKEKVEFLNEEYWFVPKFIEFQYGLPLNLKAGAIMSAFKRLKAFGLEDRFETVSGESKESLETPKDKDKDKDKDKKKEKNLSEEFIAFWKAYPRKDSKGDAIKAWSQMSKERPPIEIVLKAILHQSRQEGWQKDKGKWIPYPATWLRDLGWLNQGTSAPPMETDETKKSLEQTKKHLASLTIKKEEIGTMNIVDALKAKLKDKEESLND